MAKANFQSIFYLPLDEAEKATADPAADLDIEADKGISRERVQEWLKNLPRARTLHPRLFEACRHTPRRRTRL